MDLTNLINFVSAGACKEVMRWEGESDQTDFADASSIQAALDERVIWRGEPVTGQQLLDAIPAYEQSLIDFEAGAAQRRIDAERSAIDEAISANPAIAKIVEATEAAIGMPVGSLVADAKSKVR